MFSTDFRRPLLRLATAGLFATAALQVAEVTAIDQCSWHYWYCHDVEGGQMEATMEPIEYSPGCYSIAFRCSYGPYYSSCDSCMEV